MLNFIIGLIVLVMLIALGAYFVTSMLKGSNKSATGKASPTPSSENKKVHDVSIVDGVTVEDEVVGTGAEAQNGKKLSVNYLGTLADGTKFDSSYDRNQPFEFTLGSSHVIQGWERGIVGMKVGGKRKLTIPPELGYGERGQGKIPPNSTLVFEVELLKVE